MSETRERREAGSGTAGRRPPLDGEDGALRTGGEDGTGQVAVPPARNTTANVAESPAASASPGTAGNSTGGTARIRHNDYGSLTPPEPGRWEPRLGVSVVIAAYDCQESLDRTLASLAAQTYPAHLMEVVVADDGSDPPLRIDGPAPART
ncbi:glycosyltransferase, partial [Streptosporangium algeriense]